MHMRDKVDAIPSKSRRLKRVLQYGLVEVAARTRFVEREIRVKWLCWDVPTLVSLSDRFWTLGILGPAQSRRIVDQQLALQFGRYRNVRNEIDQEAVVGRVPLQIRMRPIGAPEHAVGEGFDDAAGERNDVLIGILLAGERGECRYRWLRVRD
jgi:hypothetical protein